VQNIYTLTSWTLSIDLPGQLQLWPGASF